MPTLVVGIFCGQKIPYYPNKLSKIVSNLHACVVNLHVQNFANLEMFCMQIWHTFVSKIAANLLYACRSMLRPPIFGHSEQWGGDRAKIGTVFSLESIGTKWSCRCTFRAGGKYRCIILRGNNAQFYFT